MVEYRPHIEVFTARDGSRRLPCELELELTSRLRELVLKTVTKRGITEVDLRSLVDLQPSHIEGLLRETKYWSLSEALYWAEKLELDLKITG